MGRILAIDFGLKRTGLASTDPLQLIASPLETVLTKDLMAWLKAYFSKEEVDAVVIGKAVDLMGRETNSTDGIAKFAAELQQAFPGLKVHWQDERYTSKMAQRALIDGGMKKKDRRVKGNVDKVSAAIILQSFMEKNL
jgi:putative holliday junction resolvase